MNINLIKKELYNLSEEIKKIIIEKLGENIKLYGFEFLDDYDDYQSSSIEIKEKFINTYLKDIKFNKIDINNLNVEIVVRCENFYRYGDEENAEKIKEDLVINTINKLLNKEVINFKDKKINISVSNEYNTTGYSIEDFLYYCQKEEIIEVRKKLKESNDVNILNNEEARKYFNKLAYDQRNNPEEKMLTAQRVIGGSVISDLIEHIGDLTHRTSERVYTDFDYENSLENIVSKVKRGLKSLKSGYGFEKELNENIISNYDFNTNSQFKDDIHIKNFKIRYPDLKDFQKAIDDSLIDYAIEHSKLDVYNDFQYASRNAAIALGLKKFDIAINYLEYLNNIIEDQSLYLKVASAYNKDYLSDKIYKTLEENIQGENALVLENLLNNVLIKKVIEEKEKIQAIKEFTTGYCAEFAIAANKIFGFDIGIYQALYVEDQEEYAMELEEGIEAGSSDSYGTNYESCHVFLIVEDKILDVKGLRDLEEEEMSFSNKNILSKRTLNAESDILLIESFTGELNDYMLKKAEEYINKNRIIFLEQIEEFNNNKKNLINKRKSAKLV